LEDLLDQFTMMTNVKTFLLLNNTVKQDKMPMPPGSSFSRVTKVQRS
jgi:hypothetical protein